jgi:hypothetical protein
MERCKKCKRSTLLGEYKCRCGNLYCLACRLPEIHACTFDYIKAGQASLQVSLEKVVHDKIANRI